MFSARDGPSYTRQKVHPLSRAMKCFVAQQNDAQEGGRGFPPETRGRALGISATGLAVGGALGPVIAALVVSVVHWRWLFCIPLFIVFILPYFRKHLDDHQGDRTRIVAWRRAARSDSRSFCSSDSIEKQTLCGRIGIMRIGNGDGLFTSIFDAAAFG
ncbi:MFS transporter [Brevibacillus sp. AY1]|uniref:MFS transporter n=1 Tax=Brevibacillus sp. AY1 TaxID=2807621 RepID=UPI0024556173|nr:MFS transporter [Brevibacillus sp. AY1]